MSPVNYPPGGGSGHTGNEYGYQPPSDNNFYYNNGPTSIGRRPTTLGRAPTRRIAPGANSIANASHNIQRGRTLIRPDRYQEPPPLLTGKPQTSQSLFDPWVLFSRIVTFWALPPMLKAFKMGDAGMQQAWREKITLCFIIACMGGFVAFITIGLNSVLCPPDQANNQQNYASYNDTVNSPNLLGILGWQFNISEAKPTGGLDFYKLAAVPGTDITNYFTHGMNIPECINPGNEKTATFAAVTLNPCSSNMVQGSCLYGDTSISNLQGTYGLVNTSRQVGFDWTQFATPELSYYIVIDGNVLNMEPYMKQYPNPIESDDLDHIIRGLLNNSFAEGGRDGTKMFYRRREFQASIHCLVQKYRAGHIDKSTTGCFVSSIILACSLAVVLAIVLARFLMALIFSWFLSRKLSRTPSASPSSAMGTVLKNQTMEMSEIGMMQKADSGIISNKRMVEVGNDLYTVLLITCYSENTEGIRATVESLSVTDYPDDRKLLFLIADGIITGHGETVSTPDMCLSLINFDDSNPSMKEPEPMPYIAVAVGAKQFNCAKVYAGHYICKGHKVPMILVVKCGNPDEQGKPKPGNRGKRDSQLILMNFFSRVTYNDRMTPLDYDLFRKIQYLMGVTPDYFELVLMVDADTKVYPTSMRLLVNCMVNDNLIMGLCGETKIANKRDSWVTAIQVYEYFISHHLAKGFEAVFGGVTCLPGCFCMYRLKARKGDGDWVPIITKPEIVQEYSSNTIDTLHQKNLLLLGEDRFLTTLMLRNFPFRKMVFTPQAICKTIVPDEFKVLLSQRRRWINSTIHNLFELVLVRNLCGTFCFSMQFVVMMDLVGTLTLPVAIVLTVVLIVSMAKSSITSLSSALPLILLIIVLFSPAFLILITTRKWVYLMWMIVYLFALPIWNFVLPVYAFWHFDDFSWGETRKVEGETKEDHSKKDGVFDPSKVPLKRWEDYERKRLRANKRRERKERQMREMGPNHLMHAMVPSEEDESKRLLGDDDDSISNMSYQTDMSQTATPAHYFDPSKEAPAKAGSGYYPTYRPQSMAPQSSPIPRSTIPLQPTPTAPGPWGPQQNYGSPHHQQPPSIPQQYTHIGPNPQGRYPNMRPNNLPPNQNSFNGF
ncbi:chitin synthase-domain-containing protein [Cokeromyces recurvatus]|uniref:chitin synthase-domain-containing protein n=1 Tax=Cokeromyces recurvatus TaxID=90255 RepID=UPI00221EB6CA|nr:chitin synthase-domain-containing protein [Cokeromyces recurvatus]KAI7897810.1 chitin synthase-domain-containing protein [Cokeromyces recurvatus]